MKTAKPSVLSDLYELVKTIEFDMEVRDKFLPTRVEIFRDTQRKGHYRCHVWELEYYHVESTFPPAGKGRRKRVASDEPILVERTWELSSKFHDFRAASTQAALKKFLTLLQKHLARAR